MTDAIAHRGPEGEDFWINPSNNAGLGHRRLSIIDLSTAACQPMHYQERYTIVYNGEIYNYLELRETLQKKGYSFQNKSDTEVILAAYACWKEACLQYLEGMFAFAIWDEEEKKLFAARDRFGEKPFYFTTDKNNAFWFASELKAFYAAGFSRTRNEQLLLLFLTNGLTDTPADPSLTFDDNIFQLPAASYLYYSYINPQTEPEVHRYWNINKELEQDIRDDQDAIAMFTRLFTESVEKRFRSDVPVGTSLSGGLDSSSIASVASGISSSSNSYKCFSAVFPGFQKDESRFSQMVAQQFRLEQFTTFPTANDFAADLQKFLFQHDEPVGSASVYAQYRVYQLARQNGVTVLLDGQGADELLAGYTKYLHWYLQELMRKKPGSLRTAIKSLKNNHADFKWGWKNYMAAWFPSQAASQLEKRVVQRIHRNNDIDAEFRAANLDSELVQKPAVLRLNDILYFNTCQSGLQELLRYADRNSMAHGCEVRLPFLSHKLAEYCFSLSALFKIRDGYTKWILRKSMSRSLPQQIVWRTDKIGFEPPQKIWMEDRRVQEMIRQAKGRLVKDHILKPTVQDKKIQPQESHAAENVDWWYLVAGSQPG